MSDEMQVYVCKNGRCSYDRIKPIDQSPSDGSAPSSNSAKCNACGGTMEKVTMTCPAQGSGRDWSK